MTNFGKGVVAGAVCALIVCGLVLALAVLHNRDRGLIEYAEKQVQMEILREDIINRPSGDYLDDPGVRGAADSAVDSFNRKRDEALQRIRSRPVN